MNRKELIEAAKKKKMPSSGHLSDCRECQEAWLLLKNFPVYGQSPLNDAPKALIEKAVSIIQKAGIQNKIKNIKAKLVFDSWTSPQLAGVRGNNSISDRRLRFETKDLSFDLRAEKREKIWIFTARAAGTNIEYNSLTLSAGKQNFQADKSGIFEWQTARPPKNIGLHTDEFSIELPELSWKKQRSK